MNKYLCNICKEEIEKSGLCSYCEEYLNGVWNEDFENNSNKNKEVELNEDELKEKEFEKNNKQENSNNNDKIKNAIKNTIITIMVLIIFGLFFAFCYYAMSENSNDGLIWFIFLGGIFSIYILGKIYNSIVTEAEEIEKINNEIHYEKQKEYIRKIKEEDPDVDICPYCLSTHVHTGTRGYRVTTGFVGSSKLEFQCLECGRKFGFEDTLWIRAIK